MDPLFFACAVGAGFVLLGLVVYSYVRPHPEHRPAITGLLGVLGFALVASPNWTSISIRSDGMELSLLREMGARQLRALAEFQRWAEAQSPSRAPGSFGPAAAPQPSRGSGEAPAPPDPPGHGSSQPDEEPASPSPERTERLFDALGRGDLDLRTLTDPELLALNELVTARNGPTRR